MQIQTLNFSAIVEGMAATIQGTCTTALNFAVGSVIRALVEATASIALWLQYLILQVLSMTRLATSVGSDVDSWVGDFGLSRLPATSAVGIVTFTSFNPSAQASTIPTGALVRSGDGSLNFTVIGGPYTRALGTATISVSVMAVTPGTTGNVQANVVTVMGSAIPGIDTVSNAAPFTGGGAAETDAALRSRFVTYINTRTLATAQAIGYAVQSVSQTLSYTLLEGVTSAGVACPGHVAIIIDDGTGFPPAPVIDAVSAAVDVVRPVGISVSVTGPLCLSAAITVSVALGSSTTESQNTILSNIQVAVAAFIDGLGVGQALRISRIYGLCYDADPAVTNVENLSINSSSQDLGGQTGTVVRYESMSIAVVST